MVKNKTCVFISGAGSNLNILLNNSRSYNFPINIDFIFSDNSHAKGLVFAKKYNIPYRVLNLKKKLNEEIILNELKNRKISLLCLAGYMKILSKNFINTFSGKVINIHPSLLPKYKGLNTFFKVLHSKEKYTGCTVHFVNKKLDSGKIILKKRIFIKKNDTVQSLKHRVQSQEYKAYSEAIISIYRTVNF